MSTRTRVILRFHDGSFQFGGGAVKSLIQQALPHGFMGAVLPVNWGHMTKREKLQWLATKLRYGLSLELYQEPRETRKKCSMYWQAKVKREPQVIFRPPPPPVQRRQEIPVRQQPGAPARRDRNVAPGWLLDDQF